MMADIGKIVISLLVIGLFVTVLILGGVQLAISNNAQQTISDDPQIANFVNNLTNTLEDAPSTYQSQEQSLSESPITTTGSNPFIDAVGGLKNTIKNIPITIWNLISGFVGDRILGSTLGIIVLGVLGSIMLLLLILGGIRLVQGYT